jgi:hypothetical protein
MFQPEKKKRTVSDQRADVEYLHFDDWCSARACQRAPVTLSTG